MPSQPVVLADLGKLSSLPLELVLIIIGLLDVPSAARFTQVNRQAQFLLWTDKDYMLIRKSSNLVKLDPAIASLCKTSTIIF
ncbi:hypothetical protein F4802DRAFT_602230 [Xylaria palmicola]|nr:hypothetical protein F4802DRAFT_602230 [Xylaria palmicola]